MNRPEEGLVVTTPRELVEGSIELYNSGDIDSLAALYSEDAVEHTPRDSYTGRPAIYERLRGDRSAFPDKRITVRHLIVEGDRAVMEYDWSGTHSGPLPMPDGSEMPPTGQRLAFPVVSVFDVRDGKTTEHRMYFDQLQVLVQLGLMTPPG